MSIQGQGHFLTLAQGHSHIKIKLVFSQTPVDLFDQILAFRYKEMIIFKYNFGHMTRWPPCLYMVKIL